MDLRICTPNWLWSQAHIQYTLTKLNPVLCDTFFKYAHDTHVCTCMCILRVNNNGITVPKHIYVQHNKLWSVNWKELLGMQYAYYKVYLHVHMYVHSNC